MQIKKNSENFHVVISGEIHRLVKIRAAQEQETIGRFVERLLREALRDENKAA